MTTRMPHYVWRHYLEAWQNEDGLVHCSRRGEILPPTNPKNLMVERDFYKLSRITKEDAIFLEGFIRSTQATLRRSHRNLITAFAHIAHSNDLIQNSDRISFEEKRYAQRLVIETEDQLQGRIEQDALPILEALRHKKSEFVNVDGTAIQFFHFLAHQYFRTKHIREAIGEELSQISPNHDFVHLNNIVCHIGAVNVGGSLFVDRKQFDIVFLDDGDDAGFITGDQPVVNLLGSGDGSETTALALYYPLSPSLSCLVVPKEYKLHSVDIPGEILKELNDLIAWESTSFWVASSNRILQHIVSNRSLTRPPAGRILDFLVKTS